MRYLLSLAAHYSLHYCPPLVLQAKSTLAALRRQSAILLEQVPNDQQLTEALSQVEELQRELTREKEERASKEASMEETIGELQESSLAAEKKSKCVVCGVWRGEGCGWCVCDYQLWAMCIHVNEIAPYTLLRSGGEAGHAEW